ncbi:alpha/beta fold hydrolase [Streptomyces shenzhenensis]|uniref:alpha/beta fold hydrolase n=1 Tax=Streptomyces shenzhenensis TaxID=943815 RepID=UPI0036B28BE1
MMRAIRATAMTALCCTVAGAGLLACEEATATQSQPASATTVQKAHGSAFSGARKIRVAGHSVNVSCSGRPAAGRPVVVLMAGGGDGLDKLADLQKTLSKKDRVCSYDRLGEGASDRPDGLQNFADSGRILTAVLDRIAGDGPVVLAGHSLGGLIAARYAPDHQDRVKGLVLMDATTPTLTADISKVIPESATGQVAELRAQTLAVNEGQNPEKIVIADAEVRSAGSIPVEIIKHDKQYDSVPGYGPALERMWSEGQRRWRAISSRSTLGTAAGSGHYVYVDRPDLAVRAVQRVTAQAAGHGSRPTR